MSRPEILISISIKRKSRGKPGDYSGGEDGFGGNSARVGYANGLGETFELAGSAINGAFLDGGPNALISNRLNSDVDGRCVFSFRGGEAAIPEPSTALLCIVGVSVFALYRRR